VRAATAGALGAPVEIELGISLRLSLPKKPLVDSFRRGVPTALVTIERAFKTPTGAISGRLRKGEATFVRIWLAGNSPSPVLRYLFGGRFS